MKKQITGVESFVDQALLFDFYGELLTEHQRRIFSEVILNDYSISEVAKEEGTSRQSVSELIKRADTLLLSYEQKLGLVEKFHRSRALVEEIKELCGRFYESGDEALVRQIEELAVRISEEAG